MYRTAYKNLLEWKNSKNIKPLLVLGVRQCGKTYLIDKFCQEEFKYYKKVNLFRDTEIIDLYKLNLPSDEKYLRLKTLLNFDFEKEDSVLFIDEIQESKELIMELKYFCEEHNNARIICAGSLLGVKLKRSKISFPVGKIKYLHMYPMNFEEFLIAHNETMLLDTIKDCFNRNSQMTNPLHEKAMNYYRKYLITGGMPESVQNFIDNNGDYLNYDSTILEDIIESYFNDMNKYVIGDAEALKIERLYRSLPAQLANISHKFQVSKVAAGARNREYMSPLNWLQASNMVVLTKRVKKPDIPLEGFVDDETYKIFLSDVGILNTMLGISPKDILLENLSLYKGVIAENYVANQLISVGNKLYYWLNDNQSEIDFLIYNEDGIIPVEVKSADNTQSKSLKYYIEKYKSKYAIRISSKDFGYNEQSKIKSIPLYAVFLLKSGNIKRC